MSFTWKPITALAVTTALVVSSAALLLPAQASGEENLWAEDLSRATALSLEEERAGSLSHAQRDAELAYDRAVTTLDQAGGQGAGDGLAFQPGLGDQTADPVVDPVADPSAAESTPGPKAGASPFEVVGMEDPALSNGQPVNPEAFLDPAFLAQLAQGEEGAPYAQGKDGKRSACAPSGGVQLASPAGSGKGVDFFGAGWGHGAGMSQYGSLGAVRLGCAYNQILTSYFANTKIANVPWNGPVRVEVAPNVATMTVRADEGSIPWQVCNRDGSGCSTIATQPKGATWVGSRNGDNWKVTGGGKVIYAGTSGNANSQRLRAVLSQADPNTMRVVDVKEARYDDGRPNRYRWGTLDLFGFNTTSGRKGNVILTVPSMNLYLRGLGEISTAWPVEVQKVQAVTSRTFVTNKLKTRKGSVFSTGCDCDIRSSTSDQYYKGWDHESWDKHNNWKNGIDQTGSQNLVINGEPINAYFSAATGGVVTTGDVVWGGTRPAFSRQIDDSRWEQAANFDRTRWVKSFTRAELGAKLGIGEYKSYTILGETEPGGRIGRSGVTFHGTKGSVTLTGQDPRFKLGLHSMWFRINEDLPRIPAGLPQGPTSGPAASVPPPAPAPAPKPPAAPAPAPSHRPGPAPVHTAMKRLSGSNRVLTAIEGSKLWTKADHVVVAEEGDWHGALAAGPYAAAYGGPLLLTNKHQLNAEVAAEIRRLNPKHITLVGGQGVVANTVEGALRQIAPTVRHFGLTAADSAAVLSAYSKSKSDTVVVVSQHAPADAVSAAALTRGKDSPVVLFADKTHVPEVTLRTIHGRKPKHILVIGGTAVLSDQVIAALNQTGSHVQRLSGSNRLLTSDAVVRHALTHSRGRVPLITASASRWADALAAGPVSSHLGGHVLLVPHDTIKPKSDTALTLEALRSRWSSGYIMGGTAAVSPKVQSALESQFRS